MRRRRYRAHDISRDTYLSREKASERVNEARRKGTRRRGVTTSRTPMKGRNLVNGSAESDSHFPLQWHALPMYAAVTHARRQKENSSRDRVSKEEDASCVGNSRDFETFIRRDNVRVMLVESSNNTGEASRHRFAERYKLLSPPPPLRSSRPMRSRMCHRRISMTVACSRGSIIRNERGNERNTKLNTENFTRE